MADVENCWLVCRAGLGEVKEADEEFGVEMFNKFLHSLEKRDLEGQIYSLGGLVRGLVIKFFYCEHN